MVNSIHADTCNIDLPKATGYVNDFTNLFTPDQRHVLDSIITFNEKQTSNEIAIVTLNSNMLGKCSLEDYAIALGKNWGVGKKEKNNGIVMAISKDLRQITIRNGYGIEKIFSNAETGSIIDSIIIPEFKKDNYFEGTRQGLLAIIEKTKP